jgi:hypothetical protein
VAVVVVVVVVVVTASSAAVVVVTASSAIGVSSASSPSPPLHPALTRVATTARVSKRFRNIALPLSVSAAFLTIAPGGAGLVESNDPDRAVGPAHPVARSADAKGKAADLRRWKAGLLGAGGRTSTIRHPWN